METIVLEKGLYYIGDPCYVVKGKKGREWYHDLVDAFYLDPQKQGIVIIGGVLLYVNKAIAGDGVYNDFFIDSGLVSIMKIDALKEDERFDFQAMHIQGAKFAYFYNEFTVRYDEGVFYINNKLWIDTRN